MKLWRLVVIVALFGVLFSLELSSAQACTGVSYGTRELFRKSSIVVKATVQQVDDFGSNGVLRVHQYFKGGQGTEYIIVAPLTPPHIDAELKGGYGLGDCASFHELDLRVGQTAYFFLKRMVDGSFLSPNVFNQDFYSFTSTDDYMRPMEVYISGKWEGKIPTEEEFINTLNRLSSLKPQIPKPTESPYPLLAPLWMMTNIGTEYILPVDGSKPVKPQIKPIDYDYYVPNYTEYRLSFSKPSGCFAPNCVTFSRNGWNRAVLTEDNTITLTGEEDVNAFLFEPFGRTMAVWKNDTLKISETSFTLSDSKLALDLATKAVWNHDGSHFAYSDEQGLWLVNYKDNKATRHLLVAAHDKNAVPYPRYFSPYGKYLAVTDGEVLFTLNLETNQQLPDGIVSPDERYLLAFEHHADTIKLALCELSENDCKNLSYDGSLDGKATWVSPNTFMFVTCQSPFDEIKCGIAKGYIDSWAVHIAWYYDGLFTEGYHFDYEPVSGALAVIKSKTIITINGVEFDFSKDLDGEIADIRWWPSLLYKR